MVVQAPKVTPGRWVYALSGGLLVAAIVVATLIVMCLVRSAEDIKQMVAPGETTMELDDTGTYGIFYERDTVFEGQSFSGPNALPALDVVLVDQTTGEEVTVRPPFGETFTYDFGDRSGALVGKFEIERPGTFTVTATGEGPEVIIAVGPYSFRGLFASIGGIILCAFLALAGAVLLIVFFFVRRSNRKRLMNPPRWWPSQGPPGPPAPPPPGPPPGPPPAYPGRP
ncbi:MAG: hypothetical protein ACRDJB_07335 [Actinomycetota bacterium]